MAVPASQMTPEMLELLKVLTRPNAAEEKVYHGFFPAEDVESCLDVPLDSLKFRLQTDCPLCQRKSHHLRWIRYSSPSSAWERGAGVAGALSLCDHCGIQVQFIATQA